MKKSTLMNFLQLSSVQNYSLFIMENGFKMDFSSNNSSDGRLNEINIANRKERKFLTLLILGLLFLFTNFLFAQQPACNLSGPLKAKYDFRGGDKITITAETINTAPGAIYLWSFKTNTSNATFASENGRNFIEVNSGVNGGGYTIDLKIVNPSTSEHGSSNPCHCSQSISVTK